MWVCGFAGSRRVAKTADLFITRALTTAQQAGTRAGFVGACREGEGGGELEGGGWLCLALAVASSGDAAVWLARADAVML